LECGEVALKTITIKTTKTTKKTGNAARKDGCEATTK